MHLDEIRIDADHWLAPTASPTNLAGRGAPKLPFGPVKRSGFGAELGGLGLEELANTKMVRVRS